MKRRLIISLGVVIVVAIVVLSALWWSQQTAAPGDADTAGPTPSSTPSVAPSPAPSPPSTAAPDEVESEGADLVIPFIAAESAAREDPATPLVFEDVATGDALDDLRVNALQFAEDGLTQTGEPEVVSAEVTQIDDQAQPPQATVEVCLDYSDVDVVRADGGSVKSESAPQRVATILTLVKTDARWLVSDRTFPDEPGC